MHSRFDAFLRAVEPAEGELPATHVTDSYTLRDLLEKGIIRTSFCSVFRQELAYCFLGRASYRVNPDEPANAFLSYAPTCVILKPKITSSAVRIFPFDTGGFNRFRKSMHHKIKLDDFSISPDGQGPRRHIRAFFGSNKSYVDNSPLNQTQIPPDEYEAESFHALITNKQKEDYDNRCSTIEIQIKEDIELRGFIEAIALPAVLLDVEKIARKIKEYRAIPLGYKWIGGGMPIEYTMQLASVVRDYLINTGRIEE